jgi:hypothetical protein
MSSVDPSDVVTRSAISWPPVIAGAVAAAGLSLTLHAFAAGVGISVSSTGATWRDSSVLLWSLAGVYVLFVAIAAFALGGYITGRMQTRRGGESKETEFLDGMNGVVMWGLSILLAGVVAFGAATIATNVAAPSGGAGASQSIVSENALASELDVLFRGSRTLEENPYRRAEAGRILLKAGSHSGISNPDRRYLAELVSSTTGGSAEQAMTTTNRVIVMTRDALRKARVAALLQAFFVGVSLIVGIAIAWASAVEGGKERERSELPSWLRRRIA